MDDVLKFAITLIDKGGPAAIAAIMALMWYLERTDRKAAQTKLETVFERVLIAMEGTASSIREFRLMIGKGDGR